MNNGFSGGLGGGSNGFSGGLGGFMVPPGFPLWAGAARVRAVRSSIPSCGGMG